MPATLRASRAFYTVASLGALALSAAAMALHGRAALLGDAAAGLGVSPARLSVFSTVAVRGAVGAHGPSSAERRRRAAGVGPGVGRPLPSQAHPLQSQLPSDSSHAQSKCHAHWRISSQFSPVVNVGHTGHAPAASAQLLGAGDGAGVGGAVGEGVGDARHAPSSA